MFLHSLTRLLAVGVLLALATEARATYPCSRVTLVVPFGPGQTSAVALALGEQLQKSLGVPVITESQPGAGGSIGTLAVVRAAGDGCTLLFGASSALILPFTAHKPYDAERDLRPVAFTIEAGPPLLIARAGTTHSFAAFVDRARASPGTLNIGVNNRTLANLAGAQLFSSAKVQVQFVPYRSENDAVNQLLGEHVDYALVLAPTVIGLIGSRTVHPLVQIAAVRNRFLPDIPSTTDVGVEGADFRVYNSLFVPAQTPDAIVAILERAVDAARTDPSFIAQMARQASVPHAGGPREVRDWLTKTTRDWTRIINQHGIVRE